MVVILWRIEGAAEDITTRKTTGQIEGNIMAASMDEGAIAGTGGTVCVQAENYPHPIFK